MMRLIASLTLASLKMYFRQKEAILWSLILPLFMVLVFGFLNFDGSGRLSVDQLQLRDSKITVFPKWNHTSGLNNCLRRLRVYVFWPSKAKL